MGAARDALLGQNRMARMRIGQGAGEFANLLTRPEVRVMIVPINEKENQAGYTYAASMLVEDNQAGLALRDRMKQNHDLWNAIRETENLEQKVFESVDEMMSELDPTDINYLSERFQVLLADFSPDLNDMSEETFDELKKVFGRLHLSGLSGRERVAVITCRSLLLPTLLPDRSPGSTSTQNSTEKTSSPEPVLSA